jgi:hypothetical protein
MTKFGSCLDYLEKNASDVARASGLGRFRQLITGARARALSQRAEGIRGAADRGWRMVNEEGIPPVHQMNVGRRMHANEEAAKRALREANVERGAVSATRGITAGALGAAAIGAHSMRPKPEPVEGEELAKKSPVWEGAKVVGTSLAGFGLGQLAGAGIGRVLERGAQRRGIDPVSVAQKVAPIAGAAAGIVYPMWKATEQQEIKDAVEGARDQNERRQLPG